MVLNTQSYMWDGMGWVGYLLGPTFRAPYGANNKDAPRCIDCCVELYWAYLSLFVIFYVWCLYSPVALVIGMFVYCF